MRVKALDTFRTKKGEQLKQAKLNIISKLREKFIENGYSISMGDVPRYDMFFEQFEQLKQKENYSEADIERIFKYNMSLLSIFNKEPEVLFSGKYSEIEIKYILGKNVKYNLDSIGSGKVTRYYLESLMDLSNYQAQIEKYYPGFSEFINIISSIGITDELIIEINKNKFSSFDAINNFLKPKLELLFKEKEKSILSEIDKLNASYEGLSLEKQQREDYQRAYEYYSKISSLEVWFIKRDYEDAKTVVAKNTDSLNSLQSKRNDLEAENNDLTFKVENIDNDDLDDEEIIILRNQLFTLNTSKQKYQKHKWLNAKKIKEINQKLEKVNALLYEAIMNKRIDLESRAFNNSLKLVIINSEISSMKEEINTNMQRLEEAKKRLSEICGCSDLKALAEQEKLASKFLDNYDYGNGFIVDKISKKLENIEQMLMKYNNELGSVGQAISGR